MYLVKQGENQNFRRPVPPDYGDSSNTSPGDLRAKRHMNMRNLQVLGHCAIDNEEKKLRSCAVCSASKNISKGGHKIRSRFKCSTCNVPLCTKYRDCFVMYHHWLVM
jgi:hypothetical protein